MTFTIKKVSDHGTSNPIVARLSVQTGELIKFYPLSKEQSDQILKIYFEKVQPRLLRCYELKEDLFSELSKIGYEFDKNGIPTQSSGRVATVPQVMELSESCEDYLYNAKSCLRDLAGVFKPLFEQAFSEARYDKIYEWSKNKFGEEDSLTVIIKQDHDLWIKRVVAMRNAAEHPGGYAGYLHIHNIEIGSDPKTGNTALVPPTWHLNDEPRSSILTDFETFISNLLEFAEDLLVLSLEKFKKTFPIVVAEIPEEERDPKCPVRLRILLSKEFLRKTVT